MVEVDGDGYRRGLGDGQGGDAERGEGTVIAHGVLADLQDDG